MYMGNKIIISETQLEHLKRNLLEGEAFTKMVETMRKDLDTNYEPILGVVREGGEYSEKPMFKIKVDGETITPKALYEYLKYKYKMGDDFTKQVIKDWMFDRITDDNRLSKNVSLNELKS